MPNFSFNGTDLADYSLTVNDAHRDRLEHIFEELQLEQKAYSGRRLVKPLLLSLDVTVNSNAEDIWILPPIIALSTRKILTFIKKVLGQRDPCELILSHLSDRYWLAKFQSFNGDFIAPGVFRGSIDFLCEDPRAFAVDETKHSYDVDADPKTIYEGIPGTAYVEPVYLLTAGEALNDITVLVKNETTGQQLSWKGSLAEDDTLEIDVANWLIKKNDVADMSTVSGEFPRLNPGTNKLIIDGFGSLGTLGLTYRSAYL